jgi:hypothetical protein
MDFLEHQKLNVKSLMTFRTGNPSNFHDLNITSGDNPQAQKSMVLKERFGVKTGTTTKTPLHGTFFHHRDTENSFLSSPKHLWWEEMKTLWLCGYCFSVALW